MIIVAIYFYSFESEKLVKWIVEWNSFNASFDFFWASTTELEFSYQSMNSVIICSKYCENIFESYFINHSERRLNESIRI